MGDECQEDADCSTEICIFAGGAAFGFCSIICEDFADCPDFWDCAEIDNASTTYCVPSE